MQRASLTLLVTVAGCGRLQFDPLDRTDAAVASDTSLDDTQSDAPLRPISFVQGTEGALGITDMNTRTFATPVGMGNLIIVAFDYDAAAMLPAQVVDTLGNLYFVNGPFNNGTNHQYIAWSVVTTAGSDSVTVQLTGMSASYLESRLLEYAGSWPAHALDEAASTNGSTLAVDGTKTTVTTSGPNELLFAFATFGGGGQPGTGFTLRSNLANDVAEDMILSDPGIHEATATAQSGTAWTMSAAAFFGQ